jgi:hypothetical protein
MDPLFDDRIADWLEDDPTTAPGQVLATVVAALPSVPQRRRQRLGPIVLSRPVARLGLAAMLIVAVGLVIVATPRTPSVGPQVSPSLPPLTNRVDLPRHYFTAALPADWQASAGPGTGQHDTFIGSSGRIVASLVPIPSGSGQDAWADAWFTEQMAKLGSSCRGLDPASYEVARFGTDPGRLYDLPCLPGWMGLSAIADRGYDIRFSMPVGAAPTPEAKALFRSVLLNSTFDQGPTPVLQLASFTSSLYSYSVGYPVAWQIRQAGRNLSGVEPPWETSDAVDHFEAPTGPAPPGQPATGFVVVANASVAPGTTLDAWATSTVIATCSDPSKTEDVVVDGEAGKLFTYGQCYGAFHQWVSVIHAGRGYHILWLNDIGSEPFDRYVFEQMLQTFRFVEPTPS